MRKYSKLIALLTCNVRQVERVARQTKALEGRTLSNDSTTLSNYMLAGW